MRFIMSPVEGTGRKKSLEMIKIGDLPGTAKDLDKNFRVSLNYNLESLSERPDGIAAFCSLGNCLADVVSDFRAVRV